MVELVYGPRRHKTQASQACGRPPGQAHRPGWASCRPRCQVQDTAWPRRDALLPREASSAERAGLVWGGGWDAQGPVVWGGALPRSRSDQKTLIPFID